MTPKETGMAKANTPEEVGPLIGEAITSGDLDAALSLYEPEATLVMPSQFGEGSVTGRDALREALSGFLQLSPVLTVKVDTTHLAGDTAQVIGNWTLTGRDPEGNDIDTGGRYADIVRRQPDGSWLFVIDNPNGTS
jgi:ketosteroid isomerase-like protein